MLPDQDRMWQALDAKDPRFDGWVFCGVRTTGIYCRPSCSARTPKRENVRLFASAAGAQAAGFRACKRCRPDATPGSPEWDRRADLVGRAMRLIADGIVDREGVAGLARRLGYSERHLHRELVAVVGAGGGVGWRAVRASGGWAGARARPRGRPRPGARPRQPRPPPAGAAPARPPAAPARPPPTSRPAAPPRPPPRRPAGAGPRHAC